MNVVLKSPYFIKLKLRFEMLKEWFAKPCLLSHYSCPIPDSEKVKAILKALCVRTQGPKHPPTPCTHLHAFQQSPSPLLRAHYVYGRPLSRATNQAMGFFCVIRDKSSFCIPYTQTNRIVCILVSMKGLHFVNSFWPFFRLGGLSN